MNKRLGLREQLCFIAQDTGWLGDGPRNTTTSLAVSCTKGDALSECLAYVLPTAPKPTICRIKENLKNTTVSVAIKTGNIVTEAQISRALDILRGVISLYLYSCTNGLDDVKTWSRLIEDDNFDFNTLFRRGYTLIHNLEQLDVRTSINEDARLPDNPIYLLERYAGCSDKLINPRAGYTLYCHVLADRLKKHNANIAARIIVRMPAKSQRLPMLILSNPDLTSIILHRYIWNLFINQSTSLQINPLDIKNWLQHPKSVQWFKDYLNALHHNITQRFNGHENQVQIQDALCVAFLELLQELKCKSVSVRSISQFLGFKF